MATPSLANIPRSNRGNNPGYSKLYAAFKDDVTSIPAAANGDVASAIVMNGAGVFREIGIDPEVGCFLNVEEQGGEGQYGQKMYTINGHIAGDEAAQKAAIDAYAGVELILLAKKKSDGVHEIIGDIDQGIVLKFSKDTGGRAGNANGYNFVGSQDYNHLPYDYSDGTITT